MAQQNQNQQDLREILQIRRDKLAALQEAGRNPFEITRYDVTHHAQEVKDQFDQLEGQTVSLAGRLMSKGEFIIGYDLLVKQGLLALQFDTCRFHFCLFQRLKPFFHLNSW